MPVKRSTFQAIITMKVNFCYLGQNHALGNKRTSRFVNSPSTTEGVRGAQVCLKAYTSKKTKKNKKQNWELGDPVCSATPVRSESPMVRGAHPALSAHSVCEESKWLFFKPFQKFKWTLNLFRMGYYILWFLHRKYFLTISFYNKLAIANVSFKIFQAHRKAWRRIHTHPPSVHFAIFALEF